MKNDVDREWSGKSRGGSVGTWFFVVTLKHFGVRAAYILLAFVVPYFVPFAPKATRAIWHYNRYILNYGRLKAVRKLFKHYYCFGQAIIDKIALKHGISKCYTFDYGNYQEFLNLLDSGTGVIIMSAHVGSWEVGAPYFNKYGKDINIVMLDGEYEQIKNVIENGAQQRDFKVIPLGNDGIESIMRIKLALDHHEYVCFQGDRFMDSKNTNEILFLGHQAYFPHGVFQLAARLNVPVVFYFAMREPNYHYKFKFFIAHESINNRIKDRVDDITNQYITHLEQIVKEYPQQWFNFYEFWNEYNEK